MNIVKQLNWRYATKKFDPRRNISAANWTILSESLRLAPSSYGLQPWKFVVVKNKTLRRKLRAAAYGQSQVTAASHFVVLCAKKGVSRADVQALISAMAKTRHKSLASLAAYQKTILADLKDQSKSEVQDWNSRQVYISLGFLLSAAAMMGIDACPVEGFDPIKFQRLLKLTPEGVVPVVCAALGYRSKADAHARDKKVRFAARDVLINR